MAETATEELVLTEPSTLAKYEVVESAIQELAEQYLPLKIVDEYDNNGEKEVRDALKIIRDKRIGVENKRKDLKAESLRVGREIDSVAKTIVGWMEPIENHLASETKKIDDIREAKKLAKIKAEQDRINKRATVLFNNGLLFNEDTYKYKDLSINTVEVKQMEDFEFETFLTAVKAVRQVELDEIKAEEDRKAEAEAEFKRKELEMFEKEQEMIQREAKVKEAQDKIIAEQNRIKAEAEKERFRLETIEKTRVELEAKQKREAEEKIRLQELKEKEEKAELERLRLEKLRLEELKPDKEKIELYVSLLLATAKPVVSKPESKNLIDKITGLLDKIKVYSDAQLKEL